jgi:hypothetical protein
MLCMFLFPYPKTGTVNTVYIYRTVKKVREFPVPSRDVTTKLSLGGNNDVINELFLPRGCLVSDIPAGDGKLVNLFYGVYVLCTKKEGIPIQQVKNH